MHSKYFFIAKGKIAPSHCKNIAIQALLKSHDNSSLPIMKFLQKFGIRKRQKIPLFTC